MIRLNRILAAIAAWINSLVWWHEGSSTRQPYELLRSWRFEGRGMALLVRRDPLLCPRDVGTIIFEPLRTDPTYTPSDIHFCIDHLEGFARKPKNHTHQISILQASHWPDAEGLYAYDEIFCCSADLQGQQPRRDLYVQPILFAIVEILQNAAPQEVNWPMQIEIARKASMHGQYPQ